MKSINNYKRHFGLWTPRQQKKLGATRIAIGGLGGVGAVQALLLSKAGVGYIRIADRDAYQSENIVEQAFATFEALGKAKVTVAAAEMQRHQMGLQVDTICGDLCAQNLAASLAKGARLLFSAVDNPEARIALGRAAMIEGIPFVVGGNVGWSIFHTTYLPDRGGYAAAFLHTRGIRKDELGFPIMSDSSTRKIVNRDWCLWTTAFSGFRSPELQRFVRGDLNHYAYAAAPAFVAGSLTVSEGLKLLLHIGSVITFPDVHVFDLRRGRQLKRTEIHRRHAEIAAVWRKGERAVLNTAKRIQNDE